MKENEKFVRGFNNGYYLAKYESSLLTKIVKNLLPTNDFLNGIFSGKNEYELEVSKELLEHIEQLRQGSIEKENEQERKR